MINNYLSKVKKKAKELGKKAVIEAHKGLVMRPSLEKAILMGLAMGGAAGLVEKVEAMQIPGLKIDLTKIQNSEEVDQIGMEYQKNGKWKHVGALVPANIQYTLNNSLESNNLGGILIWNGGWGYVHMASDAEKFYDSTSIPSHLKTFKEAIKNNLQNKSEISVLESKLSSRDGGFDRNELFMVLVPAASTRNIMNVINSVAAYAGQGGTVYVIGKVGGKPAGYFVEFDKISDTLPLVSLGSGSSTNLEAKINDFKEYKIKLATAATDKGSGLTLGGTYKDEKGNKIEVDPKEYGRVYIFKPSDAMASTVGVVKGKYVALIYTNNLSDPVALAAVYTAVFGINDQIDKVYVVDIPSVNSKELNDPTNTSVRLYELSVKDGRVTLTPKLTVNASAQETTLDLIAPYVLAAKLGSKDNYLSDKAISSAELAEMLTTLGKNGNIQIQ